MAEQRVRITLTSNSQLPAVLYQQSHHGKNKTNEKTKKNVDPAYQKPRMPTMVAKNYYSLKESARKWNSSLPNVPDSESESEGSGNLKGGDSGGNKPKEAKVSIFYLLLV